jgi:hypothetical protein
MPIIDEKTAATLSAAIETPDAYSTGKERKKLSAAFDIACSQITKRVFGFESHNRTMLRAKLNTLAIAGFPENYANLINALRRALAACDPLYSKGYDERDGETVAFIESELQDLVDEVGDIADG